ncbi:MAG: hypothetical protein K0S93_503 [Nitrososphaeraceae archaeon]|jgi:uracil-DNA glycosylase|nr:hypothetical protein [Nitrososphaeraceae archaeon]
MQKEEAKKNTNLIGRPFYDDKGTGLCTNCKGVWTLEQQEMHTTKNKKRKYGICPKCKIKHPLRKTPRTRDAWLRKYPVKRIE